MGPNAEARPQDGSSPITTSSITLTSPTSGNVTIGSTGSLSGSGTGWEAEGNVITFSPSSDNGFYSLSLQPPQGWTWNTSFSLQFFQGDDNVCGFYSNNPSIVAFNGSGNQAVQVLTAVLNLLDASSQPVSFTVFLHFPTEASSTEPSGDPCSPQPLTGLVEGVVLGEVHTAQNNADEIDHIDWESVAAGASASAEDGGQISVKPFSAPGVAVKAWHLNLEVEGEGWELGTSPAFQISVPSNPQCGLVFPGSGLKVYNHLQSEDGPQTFNLGLRMVKGALVDWIDDPAVVFDPPDPSGFE